MKKEGDRQFKEIKSSGIKKQFLYYHKFLFLYHIPFFITLITSMKHSCIVYPYFCTTKDKQLNLNIMKKTYVTGFV